MAEALTTDGRFNASEHLTDLRGQAYLEVKWRLVWAHDYCAANDYRLEMDTEHIAMSDDFAAFKARVRITDSNGMVVKAATGYGTGKPGGMITDFIEKAETKALGRALAASGFGTQFCEDYDFGAEEAGRVVDSPVARTGNPQRGAVVTDLRGSGEARSQPGDLLTPRQASYIESLLNGYAQRGNDVSEHVRLFGTLSRSTASQWVKSMTEDHVLPPLPKAPSATSSGA